MFDRQNVDMSGTDAISFLKLDPIRARGLALRAQERLDEENTSSMSERIVSLYDECQTVNEMLFVSSCIGALTYGQSHLPMIDSSNDDPIPRYLISVSETLRQLSYVAVNKAHNVFLVGMIDDLRRILDEMVVSNLQPNHIMVQDILRHSMEKAIAYEKGQGV